MASVHSNSINGHPSSYQAVNGTSTRSSNMPSTIAEDAASPHSIPARHSPRHSRTSSSTMPPPPLPSSSPGLLRRNSSISSASSPQQPALPTRLPRPLTAAELHLELEKEQEAIVNRLQRDLTALRAHSASISSSTTSTSAILDPINTAVTGASPPSASTTPVTAAGADGSFPLQSGPTHPTPHRSRERSSSSVSTRSMASSVVSLTAGTSGVSVAGDRGGAIASQASVDRVRDAHGMNIGQPPSAGPADLLLSRSRGNSMAVHGSGVQSPIGRTSSVRGATGHSSATGSRDDEVEAARHELLLARSENDSLVRKIRELEQALRDTALLHRGSEDSERGVTSSLSYADGSHAPLASASAAVRR